MFSSSGCQAGGACVGVEGSDFWGAHAIVHVLLRRDWSLKHGLRDAVQLLNVFLRWAVLKNSR